MIQYTKENDFVAESIICFVIIFCVGSVFYGMGSNAFKIEKPMGFYNAIFAFVLMIGSCTIGLILLIINYKRIEKKYKREKEI